MFSKSLATGKTTEIKVEKSEYKGVVGIDVRKYYNGAPTKKGAFLDISAGQAEFVVNALPAVLQDSEPRTLPSAASGASAARGMDLVVSRFDYKGMVGYSIRKQAANGYGKGIWVNAEQAAWVLEAMQQAIAA